MKEKLGPCTEKKCSYCCNPVRVAIPFPEDKIPTDKSGKKLWKKESLIVSKECPDGIKIKTYKCENFDEVSGLCKDYENRPEICKNTSCINENSPETIDEQHRKTIDKKFILIK